MIFFGAILKKIKNAIDYCIRKYEKSLLNSCGKKVYIGKNCIMTYRNISIGNDVYIGANACLQSEHGKIEIGNKVMFGPGVHIHGGNHKFDVVGMYMKDIEKTEDDGVVKIDDDVWIGANAIILCGVHIGRGSIVGAGSIVTKDVPPYSIYTGAPACKIRKRFSDEDIVKHEKALTQR